MLLWVAAAVLTTIVVVALLWPLVSEFWLDEPASVASSAVYRDQFAEIQAERNRGLIGETEVEAARIEIARRLLAAADTPADEVSKSATREFRTVAMVVAAALPVLAISVYLAVGAPGRPGQPFAARAQDGVQQRNSQFVANVEQRLLAFPLDGRGWDVIAPVYLQLGRFTDAVDAFHHAVRLMGESPDRLAGLAEAHVLANDGTVTEVARKLFDRLGVISPERSELRFWLAVAAEQDGRLEEAAKAYVRLLTDGSAGAWQATVAERWRAVRMRLSRTTDAASSAGERETRPIGRPPSLTKGDVHATQKPSDEARK